MLSPLDLQNKKVVTKKRKYDKDEMDEYLELVFENYKALFDEHQELEKKVKTLSDGIQYYRSIESTMQKALVLAEKTSKETKDAAILKAEAIEKDAKTRAANIVSEAEQEYEKVKDKCIYLMQQFNQYKLQLKQVATAQLDLITSDSFDVAAPELEALQHARTSLPPVEESRPAKTVVAEDIEVSAKPKGDIDTTTGEESVVEVSAKNEDMLEVPPKDEGMLEVSAKNEDMLEVPPKDEDVLNAPPKDEDMLEVSAEPEKPAITPAVDTSAPANDLIIDPSVAGEEPMADIDMVADRAEENTDIESADIESDLEKTVVLPDIKPELAKRKPTASEDETLSVLTADTIDLSDSIRKVNEEEKKNNIQKPVAAETREVKEALVVDPVDAKPSIPLDAELKDVKVKKKEVLEPPHEGKKDAPTLDSLLQSMNMSSKKNKKKGQDEDPFEFLGSVDDF